MSRDFIGAGIGFPFRLQANGSIALVRDRRELEEAIILILGTSYGERPMRPEFGCGIHDYVFGTADVTTAGRIAHEVRMSLTRWEPRIAVLDVGVTQHRDSGILDIEIAYTPKNSYDPRSLVYPFYTIPPED